MEYVSMKTLVGSTLERPCMDGKAMQSRMLCMFARWLLAKHVQRFKVVSAATFAKASGLLKAIDYLQEWYLLVHHHGPEVPIDKCNHAVSIAKNTLFCGLLTLGRIQNPNITRFMKYVGRCAGQEIQRIGPHIPTRH